MVWTKTPKGISSGYSKIYNLMIALIDMDLVWVQLYVEE